MNGLPIQGLTGNIQEVGTDNKAWVTDPDGMPIKNLYGDVPEYGANGRARISPENHVIHDLFSGTLLNTNLWSPSTSGMTQAVSNGVLTFNNGNALTANAYSIINSLMTPAFWCDYSIYYHFRFQATPVANSTIELFWASVATNAAPTDGFFVRVNGTGTMTVGMSFGGAETTQTQLTPIDSTKTYEVQFEIFADHVKWYVADSNNNTYFTDGGSNVTSNPMYIPATQGKPVQLPQDQHMPFGARLYINASGCASAPQLKLFHANFIQRDVTRLKDWKETLASQGRGLYQNPSSSAAEVALGRAFIQSANHANSASPSSATLSNTAAGYITLGGRFQFAAPAGATTDFCLFGYPVPAGHQAIIMGLNISTMNMGAAVATTATILDWSVAVGSSTVSLATTESPPTSWAPRRVPVGMQGFIVGNGIGVQANTINVAFPVPLVCNGGFFVQVIVQVPVGTATASQIIRGDVTFNGYFE